MVSERFKTSHDQIMLITSTTTLNPVSKSSIDYPDMYKSIWISQGLKVEGQVPCDKWFLQLQVFYKELSLF